MTDKIGFIGGGQMGEALMRGILSAQLYDKSQICLAEPDDARSKYMYESYGIQLAKTPDVIWQECSIVILAVKPQVMEAVLYHSKKCVQSKHLIITVAAGLPISFYERQLEMQYAKIIRVMPNTPALILEGASAICYNANVSDEDVDKGKQIFDAVGKSVVLNEQYIDSVTGLSGSGPAYVFTFIEALIDAGIKTGLARDAAETLVLQTISGSVKLLQKKKEHPAVLKSQVTSPGGTTIAGLHVLEKNGFRGIIMDAVEAATKRSIELGKS